jgi:catechol 2,3-dioxygenase-like lactoylglutathione lyase family enzyme
MAKTQGLNHLGLTVRDLDQTTDFFVDVLGWDVTARDESYPRTTVTDGSLRLTLWQVQTDTPEPFDRKTGLGLHHLALEVADQETLNSLAATLSQTRGVTIEFMPEPLVSGPRLLMMFADPGVLRIELLWAGT